MLFRSSRISHATEVPLALQSDGSVDILSRPDTEAVVEEIRNWSVRQTPPAEGSVEPALVHLHPVSDAEPVRPSAADLTEAAPSQAPERVQPDEPVQPVQPQASVPAAAVDAGTVR